MFITVVSAFFILVGAGWVMWGCGFISGIDPTSDAMTYLKKTLVTCNYIVVVIVLLIVAFDNLGIKY